MDDHSRFLVGYGLHASQSGALVLEVFRAALASYGAPEEVLTDNGSQYVTWRGKSAFTKELEKRGVRQVMASPPPPRSACAPERSGPLQTADLANEHRLTRLLSLDVASQGDVRILQTNLFKGSNKVYVC